MSEKVTLWMEGEGRTGREKSLDRRTLDFWQLGSGSPYEGRKLYGRRNLARELNGGAIWKGR
jgi:hypothetical protein